RPARVSRWCAATRLSTSHRRKTNHGKGNAVTTWGQDCPHHLPSLRPALLSPAEERLLLVRVREYGSPSHLRLEEAEVEPPSRGRETAGSLSSAKRKGRSMAFRIPIRGPTRTRPLRARGTRISNLPP